MPFSTCVTNIFLLQISYPCYKSTFNLSHRWIVVSMRWTWWDKDWRYSSHVWCLRNITTVLLEKIRNTHQVISATLKYSFVVQNIKKEDYIVILFSTHSIDTLLNLISYNIISWKLKEIVSCWTTHDFFSMCGKTILNKSFIKTIDYTIDRYNLYRLTEWYYRM